MGKKSLLNDLKKTRGTAQWITENMQKYMKANHVIRVVWHSFVLIHLHTFSCISFLHWKNKKNTKHFTKLQLKQSITLFICSTVSSNSDRKKCSYNTKENRWTSIRVLRFWQNTTKIYKCRCQFLLRIASSVLIELFSYQSGSCVGGPNAFKALKTNFKLPSTKLSR